MKIEVHLLQNFAPSCLNRDDTNTPKDCEFGGVRRARISSQCFKRAIRDHFRDTGAVPVGERTKLLKSRLVEHLSELDAEDLSPVLDTFLEKYYSKMDGKSKDSTAVLLFLAPQEIEAAAQAVRTEWDKLQPVAPARRRYDELIAKGVKADDAKKQAKIPEYKQNKAVLDALKAATLSADIALFGRMLAEQTSMRIDAACQVAQAISTHAVNPESDFYSAVDDLQKDHAGAGMLGVTGFNSACFYRYALLDFAALQKNLQGDQTAARQAVEAFLMAAIKAIPTGKQNSMAAQNPPSFGLFIVRDKGMPLSLANAFVQPVTHKQSGNGDADLVGASIERLDRYWGKLIKVYGDEGIQDIASFCLEDVPLTSLSDSDRISAKNAISSVMDKLPGGSGGGGR